MRTFLCWTLSKMEGIILICFCILIFALENLQGSASELPKAGEIVLWKAAFAAIIPAIASGGFAWMNFDQIVSYHMLFWSSNTDVFDAKLKLFFRIMFQTGFCWFAVIAEIMSKFQ